MKIFRTNAEAQLMGMVQSIKENRATWRAQWFRISWLKKIAGMEGLENILVGLIVDQLPEQEGFAFLCRDGDVVLLGQAILKKTFDHIAAQIAPHFALMPLQGRTKPATEIFDLGVDWDSFYSLCSDKLDNFQHSQSTPPTLATTPHIATGVSLSSEASKIIFSKGVAARKKRTRPCILLVEDDPFSLRMAKAALEKHFTVETAATAAEARKAYMAHVPDIVFLDIGLPDADGHKLLSELATLDRESFIVMLSGNCFQNEILKAMSAGAKGFVGKPFSRAKLLHYIAQSPHCRYVTPAELV